MLLATRFAAPSCVFAGSPGPVDVESRQATAGL